jgi:hypothetical protein
LARKTIRPVEQTSKLDTAEDQWQKHSLILPMSFLTLLFLFSGAIFFWLGTFWFAVELFSKDEQHAEETSPPFILAKTRIGEGVEDYQDQIWEESGKAFKKLMGMGDHFLVAKEFIVKDGKDKEIGVHYINLDEKNKNILKSLGILIET